MDSWNFDPLGRWAQKSGGPTPVQGVYDPTGHLLALMIYNGTTMGEARLPLVGGGNAIYTSTGLNAYWHPDWLGTSRLDSTPSRTVVADAAFAPFGEQYLPSAAIDSTFTVATTDKVVDLRDFAYREYHPTQGRWLTPDPAGIGAADPTHPQTWNRYGYVTNSPAVFTDPDGLYEVDPGNPCSYISSIGQGQCEGPPGLWDNGLPLIWSWPGVGGGSGGGGGLPPRHGGTPSGSGTIMGAPQSGTYAGVDGFPNGENLGLPSGMGIPPIGLAGTMGIPGAGWGCDFGPCVGAPGNGFDPATIALEGLGATICYGSGACEIATAVAAGAAAGYLVYRAVDAIVLMSKGGTQNVSHDCVRRMAETMGGDYCSALKAIMNAARKSGNSKLFNDAKATWKQDCRGRN